MMAAADQSGWELLTSAAMPLTCGVDVDVPDIILNGPEPNMVRGGHAARMLSPGANISGFSTPGLKLLGPRDENAATVGDGRTPSTVFL